MNPPDYRIEQLGKLLAGRYEIEKLLGKGGFASVYRVRNLRLDRLEALKVLSDDHRGDEDFAKRFANEARVAAALDHPSIVKIYDFGEASGIFWYSMQFIEGSTLAQELDAHDHFTEERAARIALPLLDALEYSHQRGVIHRDIKPDNVILDAWGRPYLMDFGIAKTVDSMLKTQTGFVLGTPAYVSPEQATGETLDGRADIYSFGIVLYEMLTGVLPFTAQDALHAVLKRLTTDPEPLREKRPDVSDGMDAIVGRALARERNSRFFSAEEMKESLEALLSDSVTGPIARPSVSGRLPEVQPRAPQPTGAAATAATAGFAVRPVEVPSLTVAPLPQPPVQAPPTVLRPAGVERPKTHDWVWAAIGGAVLLLATGGALVFLKSALQPPAAVPRPTAAPLVATPAPAVLVPTVSLAATAVPTPAPTAAPTSVAEKPTRAPARPTVEPAVPVRRAVTQALEIEGAPEPAPAGLPETCFGSQFPVSVIVGEDGSIKTARLMDDRSEKSRLCGKFAEEAAKRRRFRPAKDAAGKPVDSRPIAMSVTFEKPNL